MRISQDAHKKMMSAYQLLGQSSLSLDMFHQVKTLLEGIHPDLDEKLELCDKALSSVQKVIEGDVFTLSAENLPEENDKQKKRKKALIFFITSVKDLRSEIQRVNNEFSQGNSSNNLWHVGRIIKFAKGPFGLVTVAAVLIVGAYFLFGHPKQKVVAPTPFHVGKQIQVILYNNKQLPLSGLYVGYGADCDSPHYHATGGIVTALDGPKITDPEGCGFGRVKDVQVLTVTQ